MVRVVILTRRSGKFGVPEGEFHRKAEYAFTDAEKRAAEMLAFGLLELNVPRVIRVEIVPNGAKPNMHGTDWEDITFEAEKDLHDNVHWYIGPPITTKLSRGPN